MTTQTQAIAPMQKKDGRAVVRDLIEQMKPQIKMALPRHMDPNRMARVFLTAVQRTPLLLQCTRESLAGALITASQLGLEPDGIMGHGYLIPFKNKGVYECQFMPGYRGLMKVARQSGEISTLYARPVYRKDTFSYTCGLEETIEHVPYEPDLDVLNARAEQEKWNRERYETELTEAADRGVLRGVYAVAKFKDGGYQFEVMSRLDVELVRARSKSADSGPWITDYDAMALKTVMKRLCKWIPGSVEKDQAVGLADRAEAGLPQDLGAIIDTTAVEMPALEQPEAPKGALDKLVEQAQKPVGSPPPVTKLETRTAESEGAAAAAPPPKKADEPPASTPTKPDVIDAPKGPAEEDEEPLDAAMERWYDLMEFARGHVDKAPADRARREWKKRLHATDERLVELEDQHARTIKYLKGDKTAMQPSREPGSDG